jgi:hypothetical protein
MANVSGTADDVPSDFNSRTRDVSASRGQKRMEPRVAYRHPILDRKFNVTSDAQVFTDAEIEQLIECYVAAAKIAWDVGADFVDIKHCHGYLLHEFLSAHTRPGKFGGSFENRTRILREIVAGIRASGNKIELGVRLSAFDFVPFKPDPALSQPGKLGPGIAEDFSHCLPYRYAFGVNPNNPVEYDLAETFQFVELCAQLRSEDSQLQRWFALLQSAHPATGGLPPATVTNPEDPLWASPGRSTWCEKSANISQTQERRIHLGLAFQNRRGTCALRPRMISAAPPTVICRNTSNVAQCRSERMDRYDRPGPDDSGISHHACGCG